MPVLPPLAVESGYGNPAVRFWRRVDKNGPAHPACGRCWVWGGGKFNDGHGVFWAGGRNVRVHRYSYELHAGAAPAGLSVLHRCDNPLCVNPAHLFLGTSRARGERNAKISDDTVREIRRLYLRRHPEFGTYGLARRFGLAQSHVVRIIRREARRHVE